MLKGQIVSISGTTPSLLRRSVEAVMAANGLDGLDVGDTVEGRWSRPRPGSALAQAGVSRARSDLLGRCTRTPAGRGKSRLGTRRLRRECRRPARVLPSIPDLSAEIVIPISSLAGYEDGSGLSDDSRRIARAPRWKEPPVARRGDPPQRAGRRVTHHRTHHTLRGAFVDIGRIDGLLHVSGWAAAASPIEGSGHRQAKSASKSSRRRRRISLSMKRPRPDPGRRRRPLSTGTQFGGRITTDLASS